MSGLKPGDKFTLTIPNLREGKPTPVTVVSATIDSVVFEYGKNKQRGEFNRNHFTTVMENIDASPATN